MWFSTKTLQFFTTMLLMLVCGSQTVNANGNFFDYLPKYRKFKSHYQIDKIEYQEKRTIIHFRFVVQESQSITFYGGDHPNSWYLRTPPRMRGLEIQFKQLEIANIAVNNEIKKKALVAVPELSYELKRGDVVTCQVHFVRIPRYIRMLDMIEGKEGYMDQDKFNCFDIMIKTQENPLLGKLENTQQVVQRFEKSFNYIKPKVETSPTYAANDKPAPSRGSSLNPNRVTTTPTPKEKTAPSTTTVRPSSVVTTTPTSSAKPPTAAAPKPAEPDKPEPIDYMPGALSGVVDLKCSRRVYLPNVVFKDNDVKFSGRVKAIQNIKLIADYLDDYPSARINLYGHTDIHGSKRKNLDLSRERALAVKRELVAMGIDAKKVSVYFFGGERPLPKYKNGGSANRRVEVEPVCGD